MTSAGAVVVEPLPATCGAQVTGVRLGALRDEDWAAIEAAFLERGVLVFPAQHLTDDEQRAFGERFGPLEPRLSLTTFSNLDPDGVPRPADDVIVQGLRGNEGWHTDSSYMPRAAKVSMLSAHVVPPAGGETEWADMRAAYDALDHATRARIAPLAAHHSLAWSQARAGYALKDGAYGSEVAEEPLRPLVKVHPVTGRPALFVGRHAHGIPGLAPDESERLLDALNDGACVAPRVYRHHWQPGDIVVWDNRCLLHRALPYDPAVARVMKHTRVAGDDTELAANLARD